MAGASMLGGTAPAGTEVSAKVTDLRSTKGQVLACLTARADAFPDCEKDPQARTLIVPARNDLQLDFGHVPDGEYAISLVHDENGNGKMDKRLIIPREGFGFSRDAPVRMGPPPFDRAAFAVDGDAIRLTIRMRYML
ncbi:DUF2141 domain-containing protein [Novosphingobium malaysiense]|uniref:DUF2141 domain-containing protein n=1 Tax=Novosphingobium malaysiense TaxID=1348853 RepID=A0A0B1ZMA7_9SPHN|nr:DUF2141 domain-containing protein [Novosphingobium malaysiense]KHK92250.1 hypothetical protein LK12_05205 [Novosphingobium malaysiense]